MLHISFDIKQPETLRAEFGADTEQAEAKTPPTDQTLNFGSDQFPVDQ